MAADADEQGELPEPSGHGRDETTGSQDGSPSSSFDRSDPELRELVGGETLKTADDKTIEDKLASLKYHLLGPSLTKAGQDSVDQQKVSEIIYNASKGSKFFKNEETKDHALTAKISRTLAVKKHLDRLDLSHDLRKADEHIASLELSRDLSQHIVHIDCDAFYAAVEELDRPELRDVPMAVGKGVLTTCNYHARKFGCRSGMAGFVAMKLCPQLICLPLNFAKYTAKAEGVRAVLSQYDPRFESASIDEAYVNITSYCAEHGDLHPEEVVAQLRDEVLEKTHVTISAGIAANGRLAKIASNRNKPNGQFRIPNERSEIMRFVRDLPTRKVNGIGRVFERELDAIGIKSCGDIYAHRGVLARLFGDKAFSFLMSVYLGLGRTTVSPSGEHERKSVGTERTFGDLSGASPLKEKLRHIAEELEEDLSRTGFKGRTLVLKVKLHTYEVLTRQVAPPKLVCKAEDLYRFSESMLEKLMREIPEMRLRLMGLRCTHLVDVNGKGALDGFVERRPASKGGEDNSELSGGDDLEHEEFDEVFDSPSPPPSTQPRPRESRQVQDTSVDEPASLSCPICSARINSSSSDDTTALNAHIDFCLSKNAIEEAVRESADSNSHGGAAAEESPRPSSRDMDRQPNGRGLKRKRGRPPRSASVGVDAGLDERSRGPKQRALFFA